MYTSYFKLHENPFSIAPDPLYLYMSERHREALAHLQYGIRSDGGFVLLTGEVGAGKTTLCRRLLSQLPENVDVAYILNPKVSGTELLETICDELRIDYPQQASIKQLVDRLNGRLLETNAKGRKTVLIIDEAQNLAVDVLEQLRLLTNLETDRYKLLQIILLGQPELQRILARQEMRQLSQRITVRCHLQPLEVDEIEAYVRHRLLVAGCKRPLFAPALYKTLWKLTHGVPRLINLVCDRALLGAYVRERQEVDRKILRQAAQEVFGETQTEPRSSRLLPSLTLALLLIIVLALLWGWQGDRLPIEQVAAQPSQQGETAGPSAMAAATTPEAAPAQAPLPDRWPEDFALSQEREAAYADLAQLWERRYEPGRRDFCSFAAESGLRCLARKDSLEALRSLNHPAMLTLYADNGSPFHVVLEKLEGNSALFTAGENRRLLDITAIEARWFGEFLLLWQTPLTEGTLLEPGGTGAAVNWLATSLTELGLYQSSGREERLDGALLSALKRLQSRSGLTPDGVLGPITLIHLNTALNLPAPHLQTRKAG